MNYLAYGSNLCTARLHARIPSARLLTTACLRGFKLCFHKVNQDGSGKCDIIPSSHENACVHGVIFQITANDKTVLDQIEGLGAGYEISSITVIGPDGQSVETFAYTATVTDPELKPYSWYLDFVLAGAREHRFPCDYITALKAIETIKDTNLERVRQNREILNSASANSEQ